MDQFPNPVGADGVASPAVGGGAAVGDIEPFFDLAFGASEQACKECRRRKARCNRALPTCDLCIKYRRHCLYEKHARTPLTRKHLTEVETRLERTEAVLRQMRTLVPPHLRSWERPSTTPAPLPNPPPNESFDFSSEPQQGNGAPEAYVMVKQRTPATTTNMPQPMHSSDADNDNQRMLEGPPEDDFEWSEKDPIHHHGLSPNGPGDGNDEDSPISDGMASLTVSEREAGYLGVASGAALLRLLEPGARRRAASRSHTDQHDLYGLTSQPNPNRHVAESMIDAYFQKYHVSYPIIHEPTFRAQYSEVIPRPNGPCWTVLAYVVAAIGVWTSATSTTDTLDLALFSQARSMLSFNYLEVGNLTLVQALTLASNYQQKRDKPNSGYNYLGLATRMAMGLGLHKEFQGWSISPLNMEVRRRVWWTLCAFDIGASITFSRPNVWPYQGVEVAFPLNVEDRDLTAASKVVPPETTQVTPYSAVTTQARFHMITYECYDRVISKPLPTAEQLLRLEADTIEKWQASVPAYFSEETVLPPKYALAQAVMAWRCRNLRIIMYRPFVIRKALRKREETDQASIKAYERCLQDAKSTINMIAKFWGSNTHDRLAAWYGLYFLFQAALIPCICLRNDPSHEFSSDWRSQISTTLKTISAMVPFNTSSIRCHQTITELCGRFLDRQQLEEASIPAPFNPNPAVQADAEMDTTTATWTGDRPVGESPQTQINGVFGMMWANGDISMENDAGWMEFLRAGSDEAFTSFTGS